MSEPRRWTLRLAPIDLGSARVWIEKMHSHLSAPIGGKVAVAVERSGASQFQRRSFAGLTKAPLPPAWALCCVALLGRPVSRELQAQGCAEVVRVASDRTPHAASKSLAAITRAALDLGYRRVVSSTLLGESGATYRAAGWKPVACDQRQRDWKRSDGARDAAEQPGAKVRWEAGPDAQPESLEVAELVRAMVGRVDMRPRQETLPLFSRLA